MPRSLLLSLILCSGVILTGLSTGGCPMPADAGLMGDTTGDTTGGTGTGGTATGDVAAGQTVYEGSCINCHVLGTFDTTGFAPDLKMHTDDIVNDLGTLNAAMAGITLTDTQIADIRAFIAAN